MTLTVKQFTGDIWQMHDAGWYVTIPTNLFIKNDGEAVMGRGIALQATRKFPRCALWYGFHLKEHVRNTPDGRNPRLEDVSPEGYGLISVNHEWRALFLPVKTSWNQGARKTLIELSLKDLHRQLTNRYWQERDPVPGVAIPRLGCGNGMLDWESDVKPMMREFLLSLPDEVRAQVCIVHPTPDLIEEPPDWSSK